MTCMSLGTSTTLLELEWSLSSNSLLLLESLSDEEELDDCSGTLDVANSLI